MKLTNMIQLCIDLKQGSKDFILTCESSGSEEGDWDAGIGNDKNRACSIGEIEPELWARGATPKEAVTKLLDKLIEGAKR